jgi:hypothetical protein
MKKAFIQRIIHFTKKFALLDWIVLAILIALFSFFLINRQSKREQWTTVRLKVANEDWWWQGNAPEHWYAQNLTGGKAAYNSFGKKIGEVQSIENYDIGGPNRMIYANLKLLTTYNKNTQTYTFNYQTLQIGKSLDLTFGTFNLHGIVTNIEEHFVPDTDTRLEIKLLSVYPWEATSFIAGLQMKDPNNSIVAEIERVDVTNAQTLEVNDRYGKLIVFPALYTYYKDVTIQLRLKTKLIDNVPYFIDGSAIKVGNYIWIQFEKTAIKNGMISAVY